MNRVTVVAIANFIMGAGRVAVGAVVVWYVANLIASGPDANPDLLQILGYLVFVFIWPLLILLGLVSIIAGVLLIIGGMGLLRRRPSSRVLTLVMGALGGMLAGLYAINLVSAMPDMTIEEAAPSIIGLTIHGSYCILVFCVLLTPRIAAEFTPETSAARLP